MFIFKPLFSALLVLCSTLTLFACSQNTLIVQETVKATLFKDQGVDVTPEQVEALPYASIYAKKSSGNRAFLVLAYADEKTMGDRKAFQLKWLSASREMLVTESGRIVKTQNFSDGNLLRSYSKKTDPLLLGLLSASTPKTWQRYIDWQPGNYNHIRLDSTFHIEQEQSININGKLVLARHVIENIRIESLDLEYQNQFWLDPNTQEVIASIQHPAPLLAEIEIQVLKPFIGS